MIAENDQPLLRELVERKSDISGLKVLIAVGGWAFSQDDPTQDLFTIMISDPWRRAIFIASVKATISTYKLDGIDIDFGRLLFLVLFASVIHARFRVSRIHRA